MVKPGDMQIQEIDLPMCAECGSPRFKTWDELDFEQRLVAERRAGAHFRAVKKEGLRVCSRCFAPLSEFGRENLV